MKILRRGLNFIKRQLSTEEPESSDKQEENRLRSFPRYKFTKTVLDGKVFEIPDAASYLFIYDEMFRKEIYKFASEKAEPLIIDCGANIGLSIIYFKKIHPGARIIAFEPDPKIFQHLKNNISEFGYSDVELFNNALWSEEKELVFHSEGADGGRLRKENEDVVENETAKIKTKKLSEFLNQPVDFLKIDIEGAELEVLRESESLLKNVAKLFVEYHSFQNDDQKLDQLLSIIKNAGFRYVIQHIGVFSKHPFVHVNSYSGMDLQLNIFAYR